MVWVVARQGVCLAKVTNLWAYALSHREGMLWSEFYRKSYTGLIRTNSNCYDWWSNIRCNALTLRDLDDDRSHFSPNTRYTLNNGFR